MDGRVIPWDDQSGQPIPASATVPGISTTLMNPMGSSNQALDDQKNVVNPNYLIPPTRTGGGAVNRPTNRDKRMYGELEYIADRFPESRGFMQGLSNFGIFGDNYIGDIGALGGGRDRVAPREFQALKDKKGEIITDKFGKPVGVWVNKDTSENWFGDFFEQEPYGSRVQNVAQSIDPNAPYYVAPAENIFNIDAGGTGFMGMSGPGAFTTPVSEMFSSDLLRYMNESQNLKNVPGSLTGDGMRVAPEVDAQFKLKSVNRMGNREIMYHDTNAKYTRDTYLLPEEVAMKLNMQFLDANGKPLYRNKQELIAGIDKLSKTQGFVKKTFDMGGSGITQDTIPLKDVGKLYKKNIADKKEERDRLSLAKSRSGHTIWEQVKNTFNPPYEDYVDDQGRTIKGSFLQREDQDVLKKAGLLDEEAKVADTAPAFTQKQAYELLGMYLLMNRLTGSGQKPPTIGYTGGAPAGLKLDVPDLYKKRRI